MPEALGGDGEAEEGERLQKVLARVGVGSRRVCEDLISDGRVQWLFTKAYDGQAVDAFFRTLFGMGGFHLWWWAFVVLALLSLVLGSSAKGRVALLFGVAPALFLFYFACFTFITTLAIPCAGTLNLAACLLSTGLASVSVRSIKSTQRTSAGTPSAGAKATAPLATAPDAS